MGKQADHRLAKVAGPPEGAAWVWHTLELLTSPAWKARSSQLARLLDLLEVEHMRHGGVDNGHLHQTYSQIEDGGISRKFIAATIAEGEELGLIDPQRGARKSSTESHMTTFRLTYLPAKVVDAAYQQGKPYYTVPTNEWKRITTAQADAVTKRAVARRKAGSEGGKNVKCRPEREPNQFPNGNSHGSRTGTSTAESRSKPRPPKGQTVPEGEPPSISWPDAADVQGQHVNSDGTAPAGPEHQSEPSDPGTPCTPEPPAPSPEPDQQQQRSSKAGRQRHRRQSSDDRASDTFDIEEVIAMKTAQQPQRPEQQSPADRLRADLTAHIDRAPKGETKRISERLGLSGSQISNFKAGRFGRNAPAMEALERYLSEARA